MADLAVATTISPLPAPAAPPPGAPAATDTGPADPFAALLAALASPAEAPATPASTTGPAPIAVPAPVIVPVKARRSGDASTADDMLAGDDAPADASADEGAPEDESPQLAALLAMAPMAAPVTAPAVPDATSPARPTTEAASLTARAAPVVTPGRRIPMPEDAAGPAQGGAAGLARGETPTAPRVSPFATSLMQSTAVRAPVIADAPTSPSSPTDAGEPRAPSTAEAGATIDMAAPAPAPDRIAQPGVEQMADVPVAGPPKATAVLVDVQRAVRGTQAASPPAAGAPATDRPVPSGQGSAPAGAPVVAAPFIDRAGSTVPAGPFGDRVVRSPLSGAPVAIQSAAVTLPVDAARPDAVAAPSGDRPPQPNAAAAMSPPSPREAPEHRPDRATAQADRRDGPADPFRLAPAPPVAPVVQAQGAPDAGAPAASILQTGIDGTVNRALSIAKDDRWLDSLARDIAATAGRDGQLSFRLDPLTLGHLTIHITHSDAGASIRMSADTEAARTILADAQPRLAAEARAQGLALRETSVDMGGSNAGGGGQPRPGDTFTSLAQGQSQRDPARDHRFINLDAVEGDTADAGSAPTRSDLYA